MDNVIKTLEGIKLKLGEKKSKGVDRCLICDEFTDGSNQFTCGHPQCDNELREEMSSRKEILEILDAKSLKEVKEKVKRIEEIVNEIESEI